MINYNYISSIRVYLAINLAMKLAYPEGILAMKIAAVEIRYFASSKFSRNLVYKNIFGLVWEVVFKLKYLFFKGGKGRVEYLFYVWMNLVESHERQLFSVIS